MKIGLYWKFSTCIGTIFLNMIIYKWFIDKFKYELLDFTHRKIEKDWYRILKLRNLRIVILRNISRICVKLYFTMGLSMLICTQIEYEYINNFVIIWE